MTQEELKEFKDEVLSRDVNPPWCKDIDTLKVWVEGYETCQGRIIALIDAKMKAMDPQQQTGGVA